jgi:hypothetical protein
MNFCYILLKTKIISYTKKIITLLVNHLRKLIYKDRKTEEAENPIERVGTINSLWLNH